MPDPTAQEEFVRLLTSEQSAIHSFITSLMPGSPSVDDVLQRTNLVLWRKCEEFTLGTNFRAWAFRCASWQVRAFFKDQKTRNWLVVDEALTDLLADRMSAQLPDSPDPARSALDECMARLKPEDRDLLLEHYELGDSLAECAERTGRTVNSLKVAFFRLRAGLRRCIRDRITIATTDTGLPVTPRDFKPGQTVTLTQGVVHLALKTGTEAVIDAPAVFRLTDLDNLQLRSGRGWFHVPTAGQGFQVHTSTARILDLGTEFGVVSHDKSPTEIHVFQGKVVATARTGREDDIILRSAQAATSTAIGHWIRSPADPAAFKRSLPSELPFVHLSFDSVDNTTVPVTSTIANNLPVSATLRGPEDAPAPSLVPGIRGSALRFHGGGAWLSTDWHGIDRRGPVTVSVWTQLAPGTNLGQSAPALALWGNPSAGWDAKFKLALCALDHDRPVARVSLGNWRADGTTPLDDGEWHHLAVVYRGVRNDSEPVMELYLDGHRESLSLVEDAAATRISIETHSPGSLPLELGRYELTEHSTISLDAAIDELRITAGALTPEQVRALADPSLIR